MAHGTTYETTENPDAHMGRCSETRGKGAVAERHTGRSEDCQPEDARGDHAGSIGAAGSRAVAGEVQEAGSGRAEEVRGKEPRMVRRQARGLASGRFVEMKSGDGVFTTCPACGRSFHLPEDLYFLREFGECGHCHKLPLSII